VTMIARQQARTLPLAVMFFAGEASVDIGMIATGLMVSVIPVIILYLILSEQFIKGKGRTSGLSPVREVGQGVRLALQAGCERGSLWPWGILVFWEDQKGK
jgi:hypothetical protein